MSTTITMNAPKFSTMRHEITKDIMSTVSCDCTKFYNISYSLETSMPHNVDLSDYEFHGCKFKKLWFAKAELRNTSFVGCDFSDVTFDRCDMRGCKFYNCIFDTNYESRFYMCDLSGADFVDIIYHEADFDECNLKGAIISGKLLRGSFENVETDENTFIDIPMHCPQEGSFIAWKIIADAEGTYLVKLLVPEDARRSSGGGNKCRCDKAKVLGIVDVWNNQHCGEVKTSRDFVYKEGEMVYPDEFDECPWHECSNGIHFFISRNEAKHYFYGNCLGHLPDFNKLEF